MNRMGQETAEVRLTLPKLFSNQQMNKSFFLIFVLFKEVKGNWEFYYIYIYIYILSSTDRPFRYITTLQCG